MIKSDKAIAKRKEYQRRYRTKWRAAHSNYDHKGHYDKYKRSQSRRRDEIRREVFAVYGNRCVCCGESEFSFLSLDHVNDDGALWRKVFGIGITAIDLCRWAKKNGYPRQLQLLCYNCNMSKEYGGCPHQERFGNG